MRPIQLLLALTTLALSGCFESPARNDAGGVCLFTSPGALNSALLAVYNDKRDFADSYERK